MAFLDTICDLYANASGSEQTAFARFIRMSLHVDRDYSVRDTDPNKTMAADYLSPVLFEGDEIRTNAALVSAFDNPAPPEALQINSQRQNYIPAFEFTSELCYANNSSNNRLIIVGSIRNSVQKIRAPIGWSVSDIVHESGLTIRDLVKRKIIIGRDDAYSFIIDQRDVPPTMFAKMFNADTYVYKFGFKPHTVDRSERQMMMTYAQWWHFVGLSGTPSVPDLLRGWTPNSQRITPNVVPI